VTKKEFFEDMLINNYSITDKKYVVDILSSPSHCSIRRRYANISYSENE
jgi:hypothetical protein